MKQKAKRRIRRRREEEKKPNENFAQRIRKSTMDLNVYEVADVVAYLG